MQKMALVLRQEEVTKDTKHFFYRMYLYLKVRNYISINRYLKYILKMGIFVKLITKSTIFDKEEYIICH